MPLPRVRPDAPESESRSHRLEIAAVLNELVVENQRYDMPSVTYAAAMAFDASTGGLFVVTATNATAFTIDAPLFGTAKQRIVVVIRNASGGALGAITWNAVFKKTAFTSPANGFSRSIEFFYDGTNWVQTNQSAVDVPN